MRPRLTTLLLCIAAACSDTRVLPTGADDASVAAIIGADSAWNYLSYDVTTTRDGGRANRPWQPEALRPRKETVARSWESDGWHTRVTLPGTPNAAHEAGLIASMEFDASGALVSATDAAGNAVALPAVASSESPSRGELVAALSGLGVKNPAPYPAGVAAAKLRTPTVGAPPVPGVGRVSPGAFDYMIVTPSAARRNAARLARRFGTTAPHSGSAVWYRGGGAARASQLFDGGIGAVVEEASVDASGATTHIARTFTPVVGGVHVLRRTTTDITTRDGRTMRVMQEYSNVRVEARNR